MFSFTYTNTPDAQAIVFRDESTNAVAASSLPKALQNSKELGNYAGNVFTIARGFAADLEAAKPDLSTDGLTKKARNSVGSLSNMFNASIKAVGDNLRMIEMREAELRSPRFEKDTPEKQARRREIRTASATLKPQMLLDAAFANDALLEAVLELPAAIHTATPDVVSRLQDRYALRSIAKLFADQYRVKPSLNNLLGRGDVDWNAAERFAQGELRRMQDDRNNVDYFDAMLNGIVDGVAIATELNRAGAYQLLTTGKH